jgi:hypothetical protein
MKEQSNLRVEGMHRTRSARGSTKEITNIRQTKSNEGVVYMQRINLKSMQTRERKLKTCRKHNRNKDRQGKCRHAVNETGTMLNKIA